MTNGCWPSCAGPTKPSFVSADQTAEKAVSAENNQPAGRSPGRPSKWTPEVQRRLITLIAKGVPFVHACAAARISFQSFSTFRERHPDFRKALDEAVATAIERRLAIIEKAADAGDVQSAKWLLEHLRPQHFARNRIEISGVDGAPLTGTIQIILPAKDGATPPEVITDAPREIMEIDDAD